MQVFFNYSSYLPVKVFMSHDDYNKMTNETTVTKTAVIVTEELQWTRDSYVLYFH